VKSFPQGVKKNVTELSSINLKISVHQTSPWWPE